MRMGFRSLSLGGREFRSATALTQSLGKAAIDHALNGAPPPHLTPAMVSALTPWIEDQTTERAYHRRARRRLDRHHLVTEPDNLSPLAGQVVNRADPPATLLGRIWWQAAETLDRRPARRARLASARMALLSRSAFEDADFRLWLARRTRDTLSSRIVLHPGPPPLALVDPRTIWMLIALLAQPGRGRMPRRLMSLIRRQCRRDTQNEGWAGFWDVFLLLHAPSTAARESARLGLETLLALRFEPATQAPQFVRSDWASQAPEYALRYLRGEIF